MSIDISLREELEEVYDHMTIIRGEYASPNELYVQVDSLVRYLHDHALLDTDDLMIRDEGLRLETFKPKDLEGR